MSSLFFNDTLQKAESRIAPTKASSSTKTNNRKTSISS